MKYDRTDSFKRDYKRLSPEEQEDFKRTVVEVFNPACDGRASGEPWPSQLRVKGVQGAPGVWEMTWSFSDPGGRATFEWIKVEDEPAIRWRRVGSHAIFGDP